MIDFIYTWIHTQVNNNNFFNAVLGGFILTGLTFTGKFLWNRFKNLFIVELLFNSLYDSSIAIENILRLKPNLIKKYATGTVTNSSNNRYNIRTSLTFEKPYIFWEFGGFFIITNSKHKINTVDKESNFLDYNLRVVRINIINYLNTNDLNNIFLKNLNSGENSTISYRVRSDFFSSINTRDFSSLFINNELKNNLINKINNFLNPETIRFYKKIGIPHKYGILLYGKPGCGKSSLVHCLASMIDYTITNLNLNNFKSNSDLLDFIIEKVYSDSILVIEDIDDLPALLDRDKYSISDINKKEGITLSSVLLLLDGFILRSGTIVILTTNHPEKLDPALLRDGRIDLKIELDYMNYDLTKEMISYWFPNQSLDWVEMILSEFEYPVVPAKVHTRCLELMKEIL